MGAQLDLVAIGRVSVDLYGQQSGSRLEDVATFAKGVGGCPANVAIGAARLGLKSALITRVGDEPMGRFVREQLTREGVDTRGVVVDAWRLTSLVLLSVRDPQTFPLIFYRENCADSALCEDDIAEDLIASARAILVTGTHFSIAAAAQAQRKAIAVARSHGRRVVLDIDYRPSLWGIGGHAAGETRYARSARVTAALAAVLPECDLIVGTEEELHVAAGLEDTLAAIRRIRVLSSAVIVCKRGARGCIVFAGSIPASLEEGLVVAGSDVEVFNVLGAGDAFLAGFLHGFLREAPHEVSARFANACGALAVSRLLCSSEFPTLAELTQYLARGSAHRALRHDPRLSHLHRATTRGPGPDTVLALALELGAQCKPATMPAGTPPGRLERLGRLTVDAVADVAAGREGFGVLLQGIDAAAALRQAVRCGLWAAGCVQQPGSRPLEFEGEASLASRLLEWPMDLTVACRAHYHPDDLQALREAQEHNLLRVAAACRAQGRELLLGIVAGAHGELREDTVARVLTRLYALDIRPEWWELEPQTNAGWQHCAAVIAANDAYCRGILVSLDAGVGLDAPDGERTSQLVQAAEVSIVRGFVAGRSMLAGPAAAWLAGQMSEEALAAAITGRLQAVIEAWRCVRGAQSDPPQRSAK